MNKLLKGTAALLAIPLVKKVYKQILIKLLKNEAAVYYNKTLKIAHGLMDGAIILVFFLGFLLFGLLIVHVAAFIFASIHFSKEKLAWGILSLGIFYLIVFLNSCDLSTEKNH